MNAAGLAYNSRARLDRAFSVLNNYFWNTGSTWMPEDEFEDALIKKGCYASDYELFLKQGYLVKYKNWVTTRRMADKENTIATHIMRIMHELSCKQVPRSKINQLIQEFEEQVNEGRKLHYKQCDAVAMVVNNNFSVLTGGPGTGKTTVLSCITYVLRKLYPKSHIIFTAPTGKAARRVTESTNEEATTLHKRLGITVDTEHAERFYEDVLFIDESSMNDIDVSALLFEAVASGRKVCWVGDVNQLPSVGPGAVLRDIIESGVVEVTMLTHTFRQDNSSTLFTNIENIRKGEKNIVEGPDYHPVLLPEGKVNEQIVSKIINCYSSEVENYGAENVVVLLPYRKAGFCSNKINPLLQNAVNEEKSGYRFHNNREKSDFIFKKNDYVMQLQNRTECANGDVGQVINVSPSGVDVAYVNAVVHYDGDKLAELALAYAMTIHKSQGSEYKSVIMVVLDEQENILSRNILYTGITRAKKEVTLFYQKHAYEVAVSTIADASRHTLLKEKLQALSIQYRYTYGI